MNKGQDQGTLNLVVYNGEVISPPARFRGGVIIQLGRIIGLLRGEKLPNFPDGAARFIDAAGGWILPGFIDLHLHGAQGVDFNSAGLEEVKQAIRYHAAGGVTALLPTVMTDAWTRMLSAAEVINRAQQGSAAPEVLGVHLEGPFISPQYKGAHPAEHLRLPARSLLEEIMDKTGQSLAMITLAPDLPEGLDAVSYFSKRGVVTALGHSAATYEQVKEAVYLGLTYAVHTYSAMAGFHHRAPGALGAVLTLDRLSAELIADGIHTHPAAMKLLYRAKGYERIVLASDASPAAGLNEGEYLLGGQQVLRRGKAACLANGTLAGTTMTMSQAMEGVVQLAGISIEEAVAAATLNPARVLGVDNRKGSLDIGKDADVVVMSRSFEVLMTIGRGTVLYSRLD